MGYSSGWWGRGGDAAGNGHLREQALPDEEERAAEAPADNRRERRSQFAQADGVGRRRVDGAVKPCGRRDAQRQPCEAGRPQRRFRCPTAFATSEAA